MKNISTMLPQAGRLLVCTAIILMMTTTSGYGAEEISVPSITPLLESSGQTPNTRTGTGRVRNGFIERFGDNGIIIISDTRKRLAPDARFYQGSTGTPISLSEFQVGTYIGYTVNDQAEINVMWNAETLTVPQRP